MSKIFAIGAACSTGIRAVCDRRHTLRFVALMAAVAILAGCGDERAMPAEAPLPKLETHIVSAGDARTGRSRDGVVQAVREAVLSAQTSGRVTAIDVDVGDGVVAGQALLRLSVVEQQAGVDAARAALRAAEAAAVEAERNYRRFASLAKDDYVSRAQLDQVRAARDAANATRDAARAQLSSAGQNADYTRVLAPYAGIIAARSVEPGEAVAPGEPLLTMYAPEDLRIEVRVPQSDADAIRAQPSARVVFDDGTAVDARQVVVYPSADPSSHSVPVRVLLPRMDAVIAPGSTAKVVFSIADDRKALRIPETAIARRGEIAGVYVLKDGSLTLRQLRLGAREGDTIEVLAGLRPGEVVARDPEAALQALIRRREAGGAGHE
jgi:RND family efflux transporter MFP subunit